MTDEDPVSRRIARASSRRRAAHGEHRTSLWAQVTRVGTLGWMIALPIVAGAALGHLLDRRFGTGVAWALALMMLGLGSGGYALWAEIRRGEK